MRGEELDEDGSRKEGGEVGLDSLGKGPAGGLGAWAALIQRLKRTFKEPTRGRHPLGRVPPAHCLPLRVDGEAPQGEGQHQRQVGPAVDDLTPDEGCSCCIRDRYVLAPHQQHNEGRWEVIPPDDSHARAGVASPALQPVARDVDKAPDVVLCGA